MLFAIEADFNPTSTDIRRKKEMMKKYIFRKIKINISRWLFSLKKKLPPGLLYQSKLLN